MIDLGFLTEEEQEAIMKVLQRDAELKRSEEERVRHLPEKIDDDIQLKNMSGQWFYEAKSKRHKDKIHGTDIIRASLRRKPATIGELSSNRSDKMKNSWVNNVNKEAVVTPELFGIQEQPEEGEAESSPSSHASTVTLDRLQESSMKAAVSPAKQRKNPFNDSILPDDDNLKSRESGNGTAGLSWTPNEDSLSPSKDSQSKTKLLNSGSEEPRQTPTEPSDESQKPTDQPPVPKARKVICKITDPMMQKDASLPKPAKRTNQVNGASTPPRGILKRSSSSSSTDSEVLRVNQKSDAQNKNGVPTSAILEDVAEKNSPIEVAEDNSQNSLERLKQVRFSYSIGESEQLQSPPLHQGKEVGEFDLLEFDDKNSASNTGRSGAPGNEQSLAVKPSHSSSLALDSNVTGRDILQENMLVLNSHDTEGSSLSATETPQPEKSSSAELMTPTAFSSKISVNGINVPTVSETSPNKSKPHLNPESELLKNAIDQPLPSAKTESPQVPRADLQQGKPALVEGQSAKTTSQPDKHIAEFMKAADESISKVLDWFKRSSSAGDDKTQSEKSQGREPKEEPDLPAKTVADNGEPCKDENKQPTREFSFGENGKSHSVLPRGLETEEKQMLKEKEKHNQNGEREETRYNEEACKEPKFLKDDKGQTGSKSFSSTGNLIEESLENDIQTNIKEEGENMSTVKPPLKEGNFTLQTGFDHKRLEQEPDLLDQGSMPLDPHTLRGKTDELQQYEFKQSAQITIPDEATREKRKVKDIRTLWERDNATPMHPNKEAILHTGPAAISTVLEESSKVKESKDQSESCLVAFRRVELTSDEQSSEDEYLESSNTRFDITSKPKADEKLTKTFPSDGKGNEFAKLPKTNNLSPRINISSISSKSKYEDGLEMCSEKDTTSPQQKANFKVLSLKEKINEKSKNQISNPLQFQSLRQFWGSGVKLQENEGTLPNTVSTVAYKKESKEVKETKTEPSREDLMIQQQNQLSQRERTEKLTFKGSSTQEGQPAPWSLKMTSKGNAEAVEIVEKNVRQLVISKPEEKVDPPDREVKEYIEKSIVLSKTQDSKFNSGLQKLLKETSESSLPPYQPAGEKDARRGEAGADEQQNSSVKMVQSKTAPIDVKEQAEPPKEPVLETIDKTVALPKVQPDRFNAGLEKLLKETSESLSSSSQSTPEAVSERMVSSPGQARFFEKVMERSLRMSPSAQKEELFNREVKETIEKTVAAPKDVHKESKIGLEKLLKESEASYPLYQTTNEDESIQRETSSEKICPNSFQKVLHTNIPALVDTQTTAQAPGKDVSETVERTVIPHKFELCTFDVNFKKLLKEASTISPSLYDTDQNLKAVSDDNSRKDQQECNELLIDLSQETAETPWETESTATIYKDNVKPFDTSLEKLYGEPAEVLSPSHGKSGKNVSSQLKEHPDYSASSSYQPGEVNEMVTTTVQPKSDVGEFSASLQKLLKEASLFSHPEQKSLDTVTHDIVSVNLQPKQSVESVSQQDITYPQEENEIIEKAVAPSKAKFSEFNYGLEKLQKEASETSPASLGCMDNAVQRTADVQPVDLTSQQNINHLQEVSEAIEKSVAPSRSEVGEFNTGLQKLLKEASEIPPADLKSLDKDGTQPSQQENGCVQGVNETVGKTVVSAKPEYSTFNIHLEKLLKEASEVSSPLSKERGEQEKPKDSVSQSEKGISSIKMSPYGQRASGGYRTQLKIGLKRETLKQDDKAFLKEDIAVNEPQLSDPHERGAFQKTELINLASTEPAPQETESSAAIIKMLKIQEKAGEADKSGSFADTVENAPEVSKPLGFRRASTPLEGSSPKISKGQLLLAPSCHDDEDDTISLGSDASDGNSDPQTGIRRSSTSSEEELNPVLMALKRSADRKMPSKSLEDISSATPNTGKVDIPREELVLSAEDVSTVPSKPDNQFSNPEKVKRLSKSVPAFLQEESDDRETDTASESSYSFGKIKKSPSSLTNLSSSSGMASLSSVSGSVMSIYSGDFGNVDVKGNIQFAIDYVEQLKELHIFICQCKDLAIADVKKQRSDPYVKSYLLPEKYKMGKRKTSVRKKTVNPVFNEILRYKIDKDLLKNQILNLSVWHNDIFGRNSFLGEVEVDLGTWDWNDRMKKQMNWFPLKPRTPTAALKLENRGEMKVALQYVPEPVGGKKTSPTGEVHIWVKGCNDLPLLRGNRLNSFVKCTILPDTSRKSRQKTRSVAKTTNPVFNHTMVYDGFRPEDLKEACVELTVWDHNKLVNHFLGGLRIGLGTGKSYGTEVDWMDSTLDEAALWDRMMKSPNTWVEDTLPLRMLMIAKLTE
ncbi:synaptotagmin-like protein 2 isoform X2 [Alligator mississippiensis]|uniref:synaptotagmin-like protein 2 isoform X2 n=1 Tax=Alligator mississippiensis TaxID=8496 RepID=UPI0003D09D41|nr:synaptotagmin-like protein 2 isoform X2 [Alligator mississippiensis]